MDGRRPSTDGQLAALVVAPDEVEELAEEPLLDVEDESGDDDPLDDDALAEDALLSFLARLSVR